MGVVVVVMVVCTCDCVHVRVFMSRSGSLQPGSLYIYLTIMNSMCVFIVRVFRSVCI